MKKIIISGLFALSLVPVMNYGMEEYPNPNAQEKQEAQDAFFDKTPVGRLLDDLSNFNFAIMMAQNLQESWQEMYPDRSSRPPQVTAMMAMTMQSAVLQTKAVLALSQKAATELGINVEEINQSFAKLSTADSEKMAPAKPLSSTTLSSRAALQKHRMQSHVAKVAEIVKNQQ